MLTSIIWGRCGEQQEFYLVNFPFAITFSKRAKKVFFLIFLTYHYINHVYQHTDLKFKENTKRYMYVK